MDAKEIKSEIHKTLDDIPESVLPDVLDYLKEVQRNTPEQFKLAKDLNKILQEDKVLLEKLAK